MRASDAVDACGAAPSVVAGGAALAWRTEAGQRTVKSGAHFSMMIPERYGKLQAFAAKAPVPPDPVDAIVAFTVISKLLTELFSRFFFRHQRKKKEKKRHRHKKKMKQSLVA